MPIPSPLVERVQNLTAQIHARAAGDQVLLDLITARDHAFAELLAAPVQAAKRPDGAK